MPENDPSPPIGPDSFRLPCVLVPEGAARPLDAIAGLSDPVRVPVRMVYRAALGERGASPAPWTGSRMGRSEGAFGQPLPRRNNIGDTAQSVGQDQRLNVPPEADGTAAPFAGRRSADARRTDRVTQPDRSDARRDAASDDDAATRPTSNSADTGAGGKPREYTADIRSLHDTKGAFIGVNQECVALVRDLTAAPRSTTWRSGAAARGNKTLQPGTAIATFDANGHYGGHTAIYLGQDATGIFAYDQWRGHAPSVRHIAFRQGKGTKVDDGDQYSVVTAP